MNIVVHFIKTRKQPDTELLLWRNPLIHAE